MVRTWGVAVALWAVMTGAAMADEGAHLKVESSESGALVFVDRKMVGNAPVDVKVTPGPHLVRVSKDENFFPFEDTIQVGAHEVVSVNALLRRSAWSWYREGQDDIRQGRPADARAAFQQSLDSPGKRNPANYYYMAYLDEQGGQAPTAMAEYVQYLGYRDDSAAAHYHLGLLKEQAGQAGPAATQDKLALFRLNPEYEAWVRDAPKATAQAQADLGAQNDPQHRVQLAFVLEQKGQVDGARAIYRALAEQEATRSGFDLNNAAPEAPPTLPDPGPAVPVPAPGQP